MRLASILLVSALFTCSVISAAVEGKHAHGSRLLRSDDFDAIDEDRGYSLAQLMRLDDEFEAIKKLAKKFKDLNKLDNEAIDVVKILMKDMSLEEATYVANLYGKYLHNPRLYHG